MEKLVWSPQMSLGIPAVDAAHKNFVDELARLTEATDSEFGTSFNALITHMEGDFREEEAVMEEIDFASIQSHREQHARVLGALHHVVPDVLSGQFTAARRVLELIPHWFMFHLLTADAALVAALDLAGKSELMDRQIRVPSQLTIPAPNLLC